jgi:shikimate kinase
MSTPIRLVAGLGNPGRGYAATRHNAGFWFVDALAAKLGTGFGHEARFAADVAKAGDLRICKPMTFMNASGRSVAALARFFGIEPDAILVVHDELDLSPGDASSSSVAVMPVTTACATFTRSSERPSTGDCASGSAIRAIRKRRCGMSSTMC